MFLMDSSKIITRSQDNDYYLNHNLRRKLNENGTPFMDYRISPIDQKIIIYLNDNDLNNYLNKEYYKNNQLLTLESDKYLCEYQIFSVFNIDENDDNYKRLEYTDEDWNNYINELNESSIYKDIKADYDNEIIILKSPNTIDTNLLVIGKKTSQKEI